MKKIERKNSNKLEKLIINEFNILRRLVLSSPFRIIPTS